MTATISAQWVTAHFPLRTFTGNWSVALEMNSSLEIGDCLEPWQEKRFVEYKNHRVVKKTSI